MNDLLHYLFSKQNLGIKLGLERTYALMERCGNPQDHLPCVQVAGTNGKGSTSAILAKILQEAGYKVGLSTSPHLVDVNERIRINGVSIPTSVIEEFVETFQPDIEEIGSSFFEILTALGFWYFVKENVDIAILETGLGGRLDSVSVCNPFVVLMTSISFDHTDILGDTLEKIAFEKAGAFKSGVPCVSVHQEPEVEAVLKNQADLKNVAISFTNIDSLTDVDISIRGEHQKQNASLAIQALHHLPFQMKEFHILNGLQKVIWYGRFQIIRQSPLIIFDVAHNSSGIASFLKEWESFTVTGKKVMIISLQYKKDITDVIFDLQQHFDEIICTEASGGKPMDVNQLMSYFPMTEHLKMIKNPDDAIRTVLETLSENDSLVILGSHYLGPAVNKIFELSFHTM